ncbi:MAG: hypothetical protein JO117_08460 [Verrucomicrobia bacterium]|nr:hypothetical protein [Verrucomicrobiota bacterium]
MSDEIVEDASESVEENAAVADLPPLKRAPRGLRTHFARHNRQALFLAFASLLLAVTFWVLLYLAFYWLTLVATTVRGSMNAEPLERIGDARQLVGPYFFWLFAAGAGALMLLGLAARRFHWKVAFGPDGRFFLWLVSELVLALPNLTLAAIGNFRALIWLDRRERAQAWQILRAIQAAGGQLRFANLGPDAGDQGPGQRRALFALQLTNLVVTREDREGGGGWLLALTSEASETFFRDLESH